ncbi:hypothetical protein YL93_22765, partial [Salmonella enterica subsp. enterica serovar Montevideo]|nr:hypothetical protein [Salmonella enterica subsp. enterica serovar Montevideo]
MTDSPFLAEAARRASLFEGRQRPDRAMAWCRETGHLPLLLYWLARADQVSTGPCTVGEVQAFWQSLSGDQDMAGFLRCMRTGGILLQRRGEKGDRYSVPVFYFVVRDFISDYIR